MPVLHDHLIDLLPAAVYVCEAPSGLITRYNRRAAELWAREPKLDERFCGSYRLYFPDGRDMPRDESPMAEAIHTGTPQGNREAVIERPDGSRIAVLVNVAPVRNEAGVVVRAISVFQDITERKETEDALRVSQARLAGIVESAMDAIITVDAAQRITVFNRAAEQMFHCPAGEAIGQPLDRFLPERFRTAHRGHVRDFGATGVTSRSMSRPGTVMALRADGEEFPIEATISQAEVGGQRLFTVIVRDITERQRTEDRQRFLAEASTCLAATLDDESTLERVARLAVPVVAPWCLVDLLEPDGSIRRVAVAHLDATKRDIARRLRDFPPDPDGPHPVARAIRTGQPEVAYELAGSDRDLMARSREHRELIEALGPTSHLVVPLVARGRTLGAMLFGSTDLNRRFVPADLDLAQELARRVALAVDNARLYQEAREARRRFQDLVQGIDAIVWEADATTRRFGFVSHQATPILGYPIEQWLTEPDFWTERVVHPDDRQWAVALRLAETAAGRNHEFEYRAVAADGRVVWLRDIVRVVPDTRGRSKTLRGVMIDVTERRRADEERERLLAGERAARAEAEAAVEAREAFLARASHELRTPMTSALGTIRWLKRAMAGDITDPPEILVDIADRNLRSMAALVDDLLDASKLASGRDVLVIEPVALGAVVEGSVMAVAAQARERGVRVEVRVPPGLTVQADARRLEQLLVNLVGNAIKFTPQDGEVTVEGAVEAGVVVLRVRDTGQGIAPEHLERIFEPFFRAETASPATRRSPRTRGTGLGLAICRQIITLHGGRIWAESEGPGRGSTFVVEFPATAARTRAA